MYHFTKWKSMKYLLHILFVYVFRAIRLPSSLFPLVADIPVTVILIETNQIMTTTWNVHLAGPLISHGEWKRTEEVQGNIVTITFIVYYQHWGQRSQGEGRKKWENGNDNYMRSILLRFSHHKVKELWLKPPSVPSIDIFCATWMFKAFQIPEGN